MQHIIFFNLLSIKKKVGLEIIDLKSNIIDRHIQTRTNVTAYRGIYNIICLIRKGV